MKDFYLPTFQLLLFYINWTASNHKLLLISLDGFRYDYLRKYNAPNLCKLVQNGVNAPEGIIPVFPTVTAPNHQSLVTGLYPESHGIIHNTMHDPILGQSFHYIDGHSKWWSAAEPIWITAKRFGLKTGVSYWPGSHVKYNGLTADFFQPNLLFKSFSKRVSTTIEWLVEKNLNLVVLYFEEPDEAGHKYGPDSVQVAKMVKFVDNIVGDILTRLEKAKILHQTNIIVTTDHGMTSTIRNKSNGLVLTDHLDPRDYESIQTTGTMAGVLPKKDREDKIFNALYYKHPHVKIYRKEDIPERLHYRHHKLVMPIVAIPEEGYFVSRDGSHFENTISGTHGYDNQVFNMRGLFLASGPDFKRNVQLPAFDMVHVYSLMCHLLKITPKPSNGSLTTFLPALVDNSTKGFNTIQPDMMDTNLSNIVKPSCIVTVITVFLMRWQS